VGVEEEMRNKYNKGNGSIKRGGGGQKMEGENMRKNTTWRKGEESVQREHGN
jgi:hypothetical protein